MEEQPQTLTLSAEVESLGLAMEFVRNGAREANLPEQCTRKLELLIEEILVNICRYSYPPDAPGTMTVAFSVPKPGALDIEFGDQGVEFDPLVAAPPDLTLDLERRPVGGLGIFLLKSFASSLSYRREHGWNRLKLGVSATP